MHFSAQRARAPLDVGRLFGLIVAAVCLGSSSVQSAEWPGQSFASAASSLAAAEVWRGRFRRNDHGALGALRAVYASAGQPLWLADGRPTRQAFALLTTLDGAESYGLQPQDYDVARLTSIATTMADVSAAACTPECRAQLDVGLSAAALALVSDLHYGRIDPRAAGFNLGTARADDLDLEAVLLNLAHSPDIGQALAAIEPPFVHYRLLERALAVYRKEQAPARVRKIELTLERWRWLPEFKTPPIIVNVPQFRLFAFRTTADRAADILQMDVIVGRTFPSMRTPVFVADMTGVIFRPYWDVPRTITVREMLPKLRANPRYLATEHLEIVRNDPTRPGMPTVLSGAPQEASAAAIEALADGTARLRQQPGPNNSLGLIKFDLPNAHDIYLHATPARHLFNQERRAFSHGCIRVRDPVALAADVLRGTPGDWTPESIEAAMNGTETRRVKLARPIRVMILYGTVLAKEDGTVLFFDDLYGQDRRLEQLLGLAPIPVNRVRPASRAGAGTSRPGSGR